MELRDLVTPGRLASPSLGIHSAFTRHSLGNKPAAEAVETGQVVTRTSPRPRGRRSVSGGGQTARTPKGPRGHTDALPSNARTCGPPRTDAPVCPRIPCPAGTPLPHRRRPAVPVACRGSRYALGTSLRARRREPDALELPEDADLPSPHWEARYDVSGRSPSPYRICAWAVHPPSRETFLPAPSLSQERAQLG